MSLDYSDSKYPVGSTAGEIYPQNAKDTTGWNRLEPLVSAQILKTRHLFGIPLVSMVPNPVTKKRQELTDDIINDLIQMAVSKVEELTGTMIFPCQFREKHPFDRNTYDSFGYMRVHNRPVSSLERITITTSNGADIFAVPLDWVETAYLIRGQINIIPMTISTPDGNNVIAATQSGGGAAFLAFLSYKGWIPAFWQIEYTCGYKDGTLPKIINNLIGIVAAMDVLSMLGATMAISTSASLSIDGLSQSSSGPGPQVYATRIADLEKERDKYVKIVKRMCGLGIYSDNV